MAYNKKLAERIRESLSNIPDVEEKEMMGGLVFMVNGKMCLGVYKEEMMCRIDPEIQGKALEKPGSRIMELRSRPMKGYILVDDTGIRTQKDFDYWRNLALEFNTKAKSSKKKKINVVL